MAVPKKRKSIAKSKTAKAGKRAIPIMALSACPNCGVPHAPHRICGNCGYYNGRVHKLKAHASTEAATTEANQEEA